jgi:CRP-like cAMP-binding protein
MGPEAGVPAREPSFFDGLTGEEFASLLAQLPRRHYKAGATVVLQGDAPRSLFVVLSGWADVSVTDVSGIEGVVGHVGPASSFGEMSLLTGRTATATVRAATDMEVLVISGTDFERLVAESPQIYRNLGGILSARLARSNLRVLREHRERVTILANDGAPPLLGYALACSLAWHFRRPVLHLVLDEDPREGELTALAKSAPNLEARFRIELKVRGAKPAPSRATVVVTSPHGPFIGASLRQRLTELTHSYHHVLLEVPAGARPGDLDFPTIELAAQTHSVPAGGSVAPGHTILGWDIPPGSERPERSGELRVAALGYGEEAELAAGLLPPKSGGLGLGGPPCGRAQGRPSAWRRQHSRLCAHRRAARAQVGRGSD